MITSLHYEIIPHEKHRVPGVGDYWEDPPGSGNWQIRVSDVGDWRMALLIAVHEIVELGQTENEGIAESAITAFDLEFERRNIDPEAEPGDHPDAPYREAHRFAENIERLYAQRLGVNWQEYDKRVMEIWRKNPKTNSP